MKNAHEVNQDITQFLLQVKKQGQEWVSEKDVANHFSYSVADIRPHLLVIAADGIIELEKVDEDLRVRLVKPMGYAYEPHRSIKSQEAVLDAIEVTTGILGQLGCGVALIGGLIGVVLAFAVIEPTGWPHVLIFGAAGLVVGGVAGKALM